MNGKSAAPITGTHHVGMSVADLDAALALLGGAPRHEGALADGARQALSRPPRRLSRRRDPRRLHRPARRHDARAPRLPGSAARSQVPDADRQSRQRPSLPRRRRLRRGLAEGGGARRAADRARGPGRGRPTGPTTGARVGYLRIHDGITLEFFQPARGVGSFGMIKRVSFLRRKDGMDREAILRPLDRPACRDRPPVPRPARPALRPGRPLDVPEDAGWDGVGEVWFDSIAAATRAFATEPYLGDADRGSPAIHRRGAVLLRRGAGGLSPPGGRERSVR